MVRRKVGRVKIDFAKIEILAADHPLRAMAETWVLSRKSSMHRCKDGGYTLSLIWKAAEGNTQLLSTIRGIRPEAA